MPCGRAEVPDVGVALARQQAEAPGLVVSPGTDHGRRDVADVTAVEAQKRAEVGFRQPGMRPGEPVAAEHVHVDAHLPVDGHGAERR